MSIVNLVNALPGRHPRRLPAIMNITEVRALESERAFQRRVKQLLHVNGWLQFSQPTTQEQVKNEGDPGYPDLTATRDGRILFIELKKQGEYPRPEQQDWLTDLRKNSAVEVYSWQPSDWPKIERVIAHPQLGGAA